MMNNFHGISSENPHPFSLKLKFGKASSLAFGPDIGDVVGNFQYLGLAGVSRLAIAVNPERRTQP